MAFSAAAGALLLAASAFAGSAAYGQRLALIDGVDFYSNGYYTGGSSGAYQCVEVVHRAFSAWWGVNYSGYGYARNYWYGIANDSNFVRFPNGSTTSPPQPHQAIVFDDGNIGHIGLVTSVASSSVTICDQNRNQDNACFTSALSRDASGRVSVASFSKSYPVLGWVAPANATPSFESYWPMTWNRTSPDLTRDVKAVRATYTAESAMQVVVTRTDGHPETFRLNDGSVSGRARGTVDFPLASDAARFSAISVIGVVNVTSRGDDILFFALRATDNKPVVWAHRRNSAWASDNWVPVTGMPAISACLAAASDGTRVRLSTVGTDGRALFCSDTTIPGFSCAPAFASPYAGVVPVIAYDSTAARTAFVVDSNTVQARYSSSVGTATPTSWVPGANSVQELDMVLAPFGGKIYNLWRGGDDGLRFSSAPASNVTLFVQSTVRLGDAWSPRAPALVGTPRELITVFAGEDGHLYWGRILSK